MHNGFLCQNGCIENYMLLTFNIRMDIIVLEFDRKNTVIVVSFRMQLNFLV